jgi:hypothetical protein
VYAGLTGAFFLLPFNLVQVQGYSSTATGAAFLPFAGLIALLSPRVGRLVDRIGTKPLLIAGPLITAVGLAAMALPGIGGSYATTFLVPLALAGLGTALTAGPSTTSALGAVDASKAGIASGVNSTAARLGTLLAVAIVGVVALALYGRALERRLAAANVPADEARLLIEQRRSLADTTLPEWIRPEERDRLAAIVGDAFLDGFRGSMLMCAGLLLAAGGVAAAPLRSVTMSSEDLVPAAATCFHRDTIGHPRPTADGCVECIRLGDTWVHLRMCLACGHVGCCDSSKNRHATRHFWTSNHPIVRSMEPGEDWRWCYVDEVAV